MLFFCASITIKKSLVNNSLRGVCFSYDFVPTIIMDAIIINEYFVL